MPAFPFEHHTQLWSIPTSCAELPCIVAAAILHWGVIEASKAETAPFTRERVSKVVVGQRLQLLARQLAAGRYILSS